MSQNHTQIQAGIFSWKNGICGSITCMFTGTHHRSGSNEYLQVLVSTHKYLQVKNVIFYMPQTKILIYQDITTSGSSEPVTIILLPFGCLSLSRKTAMTSSCGTAPGKSHHALRTEAAHVLSSKSEWCIFDTISPLQEKALSTSVEVARRIGWQIFKHRT
jgi:hypothetical protein